MQMHLLNKEKLTINILALVIMLLGVSLVSEAVAASTRTSTTSTNTPKTPIKHLVVIFQENVAFDHYFGTYPNATKFTTDPNTPSANGLTAALLNNNPNGN